MTVTSRLLTVTQAYVRSIFLRIDGAVTVKMVRTLSSVQNSDTSSYFGDISAVAATFLISLYCCK